MGTVATCPSRAMTKCMSSWLLSTCSSHFVLAGVGRSHSSLQQRAASGVTSGEAAGGFKKALGCAGPENVSNQKQLSIKMVQIWRAGFFWILEPAAGGV